MVYGFAVQAEPGDQISDIELEQSIRRNFSGLDDLDPVKIFSRHFPRLRDCLKVIKYTNAWKYNALARHYNY
jgi:hypothetical protein